MIPIALLLFVAFCIVLILYINERKISAGHEAASGLRQISCEVANEKIDELYKDIWILIDGGMCQQEATETKYRKQRKEYEDRMSVIMRATPANSGGLSRLGGLGGFMQPIKRS